MNQHADPNERFRRRMSMPTSEAPEAREVSYTLFSKKDPVHEELGVIDPREAFRPIWVPAGAALALLLARLADAGIWGWYAMKKAPFLDPGWFATMVQMQADHHPVAIFRSIVRSTFLPNVDLWAWIHFLIEGALATSLVLGLFAGLGALLAFLWGGAMALGMVGVPIGRAGDGSLVYAPDFLPMLLVVLPLVVWVTKAGRYYGIDGWLRPHLLASNSGAMRWIATWLM